MDYSSSNQSALDIDKILSYAVPNNVDKIIERVCAGDEEKEDLLWRMYMKKNYGVDDSDPNIKSLIKQCSYCDVCENLEQILETYFECNQYPSVQLLTQNVYDLLENGEMPDIEDTEDENVIVDLTSNEISLPEVTLETDETIDFFNKVLYQPRSYIFPHGIKVLEFNLANLNGLLNHQHLFNQDLLDLELSRKYDLANDEVSDDESSSDDESDKLSNLIQIKSDEDSQFSDDKTEIDSDVDQSFFDD